MSEFWTKQIDPGYYDKIFLQGVKKNSGIQSNWHNITFTKISKLIELNSIHLDYACGPGTFIGNYIKSNSLGVDISEKQISYAKNTYSKKGEFKTTEEFSFENYYEKFDYITIIGLLEFINQNEIIDLVNKLNLTLKPSGKIYLTTPNYRGLMYFLDKLINIFGKVSYKNQVVNRFNKDTLEQCLTKTNFTRIEVKKIVNFGVFFSIFGHKLGLKIEYFFERLFNNYFGSILFVELKK